jgi:hypothetical protein
MATVRKVGKRQLKVLCDCKRKHLITADDEGEVEIETFALPADDKTKTDKEQEDGKNRSTEKDSDLFDLIG